MSTINTSPDISKLDFSILYDISTATPSITLTNQSIGTGLDNCSWWYVIETPTAQFIHKGTQTSPDVVDDDWTTIVVPDAWPQPFGQIEWSGASYKATLYVIDSEDNVFSQSYSGTICRPNGSTVKTIGNFGYGDLTVSVKCEQAQLVITDTTNYVYQTLTGDRVSKEIILIFPPDNDGNVPARQVINNMNAAVFTISYNGNYSSYINTVYDYAVNENVTVRVQYKVNQSFKTQCNIDLCPVICEIDKLIANIQATCGNNIDPESTSKLLLINSLLAQAFIGKQQPLCGIDVAAIVDRIMEIGGFSCNCIVPGNGVNGSPLSGINIEVDATCGDIEADVQQLGNNVLISLRDKSYLFKVCDTIPTTAFTVETDSGANCQQIYCLNVNLDTLKTDLGIQPGCCPYCVDVRLHSAPDQTPVGCPGWYGPVTVYDPTNTSPIGIANDVNELVGILNGNPDWIQLGLANAAGNCIICFKLLNGTTIVPNVCVEPGAVGPCVDNEKTYQTNVKDFATGVLDVPLASFPRHFYVSYTGSGTKYPLGELADYAALVVALAAETNKPVNITYNSISQTNPSVITIEVDDSDCDAGVEVTVYCDITTVVIWGASDNATNDNLGAEVAMYPRDAVKIGKFCGDPSIPYRPWHTMLLGTTLLVMDSDSGSVWLKDINSPLNPIALTGLGLGGTLPSGSPNVPFSGIPQYFGSDPSHWDTYFPTDVNAQTDGNNIYVMESTSGCIWKFDANTLAVYGYFYSPLLVGMCPRVIKNNKLYFSMDGNRLTATGQTNPISKGDLLYLDLTAFSAGSLAQFSVAGGLKELWAMSVDPSNPNTAWISTSAGDLIKYDLTTDTVTTTYSGKWGVSFGTGAGILLLNSYIYNNRLYVSSHGYGTYYIDLVGIGLNSPVAFETLVLAGNPNNLNHYNFIFLPQSGYGILTYENGTNAGSVAKYTIDGIFMELIPLGAGVQMYNVVYYYGANSSTPNTYCAFP